MEMTPEEVDLNNLNEYLNYLITEFYKNNLQPYFDALHDDVLWIGPHTGQVIQGKDNLVQAFSQEMGQVEYYLGLISTRTIRLSQTNADTVSFFERTAIYPDSDPITFDLCYHLTWIKTDFWRMRVVNIFTQTPKYYEGSMYPVKPTRIKIPRGGFVEESLQFKETGTGNILLIAPSRIQWVESKGHHSILHMDEKSIMVSAELRSVADKLYDTHVHCHASYLVNPANVTSIRRFSVTVNNDITLPIPEKKYTAVKKRIAELAAGDKRENAGK